MWSLLRCSLSGRGWRLDLCGLSRKQMSCIGMLLILGLFRLDGSAIPDIVLVRIGLLSAVSCSCSVELECVLLTYPD